MFLAGFYIYIETSFPRINDDKALLMSHTIDGTLTQCLTFYYHMYGTDINTLNLYAAVGNIFGTPIFTLTGSKGDMWHKASVNLPGTVTNPPTNVSNLSSYVICLLTYFSKSNTNFEHIIAELL